MIAHLLFVALAAAPTHRVLVLDVEAVGVDANDAKAATRVVAAAAADVDGVEVISADDIRRLAALEADKSAAGCTDTSCLAEIAGALGAERVLFGSLSKLGATTTASLSLYTAGSGAIDRASVDVADLSGLSTALRGLVGKLLRGEVTSTAPSADPTGPPSNPWFGVLVGGSVGAVVGAATAGISEVLIEQPERDGSEKEAIRVVGISGIVVAGVGVVVAVVGVVAGGLE